MEVERVVERLKDFGGTVPGLVFGGLLSVPFLQLVPDPAWGNGSGYWAVLAGLNSIWFLLWAYWRWGPFKRRVVRLVLAVYCDRDSERREIEEDFLRELREVLVEGNLGSTVALIAATSDESREASSPAQIGLLAQRKRAHLLLHGRVRTREEDGALVHYVELKALVRHAELHEKAQQSFAADISSVFPTEILKIPKNDQLPQLKLTAEWVGFASRYIISLAAATVGDLDYADRILSDAELLLGKVPLAIQRQRSLEERVRNRRHEVAVLQARQLHLKWRKLKDPASIARALERLNFASSRGKLRAENAHLLAQAMFVSEGDAEGARRVVNAAMFDHPISYLNAAFLAARCFDFAGARKMYSRAVQRSPDDDALAQVYEFFEWMKSRSPEDGVVGMWCEATLRRTINANDLVARARYQQLLNQPELFPPSEQEKMRNCVTR